MSQDMDSGRQPAPVPDADEVGSDGVDQDPRGYVDVAADLQTLFDQGIDVDLAAQPLPEPLHLAQRPAHLGQVGDCHAVVSVTDLLVQLARPKSPCAGP